MAWLGHVWRRYRWPEAPRSLHLYRTEQKDVTWKKKNCHSIQTFDDHHLEWQIKACDFMNYTAHHNYIAWFKMTFAWLAPFPRLLKAIQSYPRLSKAIQGYPRHQKMHGEAPRHQSEETNCGIIRCVNSHSNRSCSARARNGLTRYHFGTDFRPHSSEATIKWQGVWFTEPSNHTFRPPFKLVSKNQIYINLLYIVPYIDQYPILQ